MSEFRMVNGGMGNSWLQIADEGRSDLYEPRFNWTYQLRNDQSAGRPNRWIDSWPRPKICSGSADETLSLMGQDSGDSGLWASMPTISRGSKRPWFLRGYCKDNGGNPLGGAVVQAFITSTDTYVAEIACDDRGFYAVPCYSTVAHYLVAYYPGAPDKAGASVNTLIPSL